MMRRSLLHLEGANVNSGENDTWKTSPALVERWVNTCSIRMRGGCCAVEAADDRQGIPRVTSHEHLLIIDTYGKPGAVGNAAGVKDVEACLGVIDSGSEVCHINSGVER